jgi:hypothetical protein
MNFFQFETDFIESLRCIPMQVRYKLDTCGVKLKLSHWNHFSQTERQKLVDLPCETEIETQTYRSTIHRMVAERGDDRPSDLALDPTPEWQNSELIPSSVAAQSSSLGIVLTSEQWRSLTPLQRFALVKLSRSNHENSNFLPALQEFGLK